MALSAADLPAIYTLLVNSMNQDETVRKPAEAALSQSESRPGFCSCLVCFPMEVPPLISSTLQKLVVICLSGGDDDDPSKTAVKASLAAILARISVDNVSSPQKKTFGLALSIILTLRLPQVLDKLDQILSVCTSVILGATDDLTEEVSSGDTMSSSRSHGEGSLPSKELRRRQITFSDPINQLSLENSVRENLQTCAALHGESFNSATGRMHPAAFAQLKPALRMP